MIYLQALADGVAAMDNGAVVAAANKLADTRSGHLGILLCKIHGNLANEHNIVFTTLAGQGRLRHVIVIANSAHNLVDGEGLVVHLHGSLNDALGKAHVDAGVVDNGIGQKGIDDSLEVAHAAIGGLSNILHHLGRYLQSITLNLAVQDVHAQLGVGLFHLGNQSARESGDETLGHSLEVNGRTVAGQDDALAVAEKVVEDVEEGLLCLRGSHPLLNIIDNKHVDGLIERDEIVGAILHHRIGILHLEQSGTDIEYTLLGIEFLGTHTDGIDEMRLATT